MEIIQRCSWEAFNNQSWPLESPGGAFKQPSAWANDRRSIREPVLCHSLSFHSHPVTHVLSLFFIYSSKDWHHKHELVFLTLAGFEHRHRWLRKPALNCCPLLTCLPAGHVLLLISKNGEEMTSLTVQTGLKVWTSCFGFFGPSHGSKEGIGFWTLNLITSIRSSLNVWQAGIRV